MLWCLKYTVWPLLYVYFSGYDMKGNKHTDGMKFVYTFVFHVYVKALVSDLDLLFAGRAEQTSPRLQDLTHTHTPCKSIILTDVSMRLQKRENVAHILMTLCLHLLTVMSNLSVFMYSRKYFTESQVHKCIRLCLCALVLTLSINTFCTYINTFSIFFPFSCWND